jgi:hypothetical protein
MREDLEERQRLWRRMHRHVEKLAAVRGRGGAWELRLTRLVGQLEGFNPSRTFPQVPAQPSRTEIRTALVRRAHHIVSAARGAEASDANHVTARALARLCPELCADLTPELVRKIVSYRKK